MHILVVNPDSNRKLVAESLRQMFKLPFQLVHKLLENLFYSIVLPAMRDHHLVGWNGDARLDEIAFLKRLILLCRFGDSLFQVICLDKPGGG